MDVDIELALMRAAKKFDVPYDLVRQIASVESALDQKAKSPKGAIGVMQLMPSTAKELGVDPYDMEQNIMGGVKYLKQQLDRFKDPKLAIAAYNAGPGAVKRAGGKVPNIKETKEYVKKVSSGFDLDKELKAVRKELNIDAELAKIRETKVPTSPFYGDTLAEMAMPTGERIGKALGLGLKGIEKALSLPKEYIVEPTLGKGLDLLAGALGVPTREETPSYTRMPIELIPGTEYEAGMDVEPSGLEANMPIIHPVDVATELAGLKLLSMLGMIPKIAKASKAGTRYVPRKGVPGHPGMEGKFTKYYQGTEGPLVTPLDFVDDVTKGEVVRVKPINVEGEVVGAYPFREKDLELRLMCQEAPEFRAPRFRTLETSEAMADRIDDFAPGFKEYVYYPMKQSERVAHSRSLLLQDEVKAWRNKLYPGQAKNAGAAAIAARKGGTIRLEKMGIRQPKKLTPIEEDLIEWSRAKFDDWYEQINKARIMAGKKPFKKVEDYVTFMRDFQEIANSGLNPVLVNYRFYEPGQKLGLVFKYGKAAKKIGPVETDLLKIVGNYGKYAERYIAKAPHAGKLEQFVEQWKLPDRTVLPALDETNPSLAKALRAWATRIAEEPQASAADELLGSWLAEKLQNLAANIAIFTLSAYPKSALNQVGALAFAGGEVGIKHLLKGIKGLANPENWERITKISNAIPQRRMDVFLEELGRASIGGVMGKTGHALMKPLETVDYGISIISGLAAESKGKALGLTGKRLSKFIDEVVTRTQGSASMIDRSAIQASKTGRALTTFQTFTISEANWIARHLMGINNPDWTKKEMLKKLGGLLATGLGLTMAYKSFGLPSPVPNVAKAWEIADQGGTGVDIAVGMGKEFSPMVPIIGGSFAYGSAPGGPLASKFFEASKTLARGRIPYEQLLSLTRWPAGGVTMRLLKSQPGLKFRANVEQLTGLPVGPRGKQTVVPLTAFEALFGREIPFKGRGPY